MCWCFVYALKDATMFETTFDASWGGSWVCVITLSELWWEFLLCWVPFVICCKLWLQCLGYSEFNIIQCNFPYKILLKYLTKESHQSLSHELFLICWLVFVDLVVLNYFTSFCVVNITVHVMIVNMKHSGLQMLRSFTWMSKCMDQTIDWNWPSAAFGLGLTGKTPTQLMFAPHITN